VGTGGSQRGTLGDILVDKVVVPADVQRKRTGIPHESVVEAVVRYPAVRSGKVYSFLAPPSRPIDAHPVELYIVVLYMNMHGARSVAEGYGIPGVGLDGDEIPCSAGGLCGNPLVVDTRMNRNDIPCLDGSINPLLDRQEGAIGGSPGRVVSQSVAAAIGTIGADMVSGGMNIGKQKQPGDQK